MIVDLEKEDLISLVKGKSPSYEIFGNSLVKSCGSYNGSHGTWSWSDHSLNELSEKELFELYCLCKQSWI